MYNDETKKYPSIREGYGVWGMGDDKLQFIGQRPHHAPQAQFMAKPIHYFIQRTNELTLHVMN